MTGSGHMFFVIYLHCYYLIRCMADHKPQVITTRQAKKQVNTFGISLVIYILLNHMLWYGFGFLQRYSPALLQSFDSELVIMVFFIAVLLISGLGFFSLSSKALKLDIRDYLQKPKISFTRMAVLAATGIAVTYFFTAISSFFRFLIHPSYDPFTFVGNFSSVINIIKNAVYFLLFVIVRPWCDEYVFRGVIQRQLGHYNRYFGVIASAFLYSLAQPGLTDAIPAFFTGWFLAIVTYRYHSIIPARRIRMIIALFSWFIAVMPERMIIIPTVLIALVYLVAGYSLIGRKINFHASRSGALNPKLWRTLLTSFTIILSMILFIGGCVLSFMI